MGLRFRQRIKVFPGVHLNVSLGGMSVSMGGPGATVNVGKGMRVRGTVGLPGTGLSYQGTLHPGAASSVLSPRNPSMPNEALEHPVWSDGDLDVPDPTEAEPQAFTGAPWTPPELMPVQNLIIEACQERQQLDEELVQLQQSVESAQAHLAQVDTWFGRWFFKQRIRSAQQTLQQAESAYEHVQALERKQGIPISWSVDEGLQRCFAQFNKDIQSMLNHAQGWHLLGITNKIGDNRAWLSSPMMSRARCTVGFGRPAFFAASTDPFLQSAACVTCDDGLALYFYPSFILVQRKDVFGLLPPEDLSISVDTLRVAEHDPAYAAVPADEYTWHYVNKNGTPDMRYTANPQVPLLDYHRLTLSAPQGLHETILLTDNAYAFASWMGVREWYESAHKYQALQEIPITPVQWSIRHEPDAIYFVAQQDGKELLGFGFTRHADQFWICLNTEPLGVGLNTECTFYFWLDGQRLELLNLPGITQRIGVDDAAFRVMPSTDGQDRAYMQQCLSNAKELVVLVENQQTPMVHLRFVVGNSSPYWQALQNLAVVA